MRCSPSSRLIATILAAVLLCCLLMTLVLQRWITRNASDSCGASVIDTRQVDCAACLREETGELSRVRDSVLKSLEKLEDRYVQLQREIEEMNSQLASLRSAKAQIELEVSKLALQQKRIRPADEAIEKSPKKQSKVFAPLRIVAQNDSTIGEVVIPVNEPLINYSRCSLAFPFKVFVYGGEPGFSDALTAVPLTQNSSVACVFVAFLNCSLLRSFANPDEFATFLRTRLKHFRTDEANHVIFLATNKPTSSCFSFPLPSYLNAIFVTTSFFDLRPWDLTTFPASLIARPPDQAPSMLPLRRPIFLTVFYSGSDRTINSALTRMRDSSPDQIEIHDKIRNVDWLESGLCNSTFVLIFPGDSGLADVEILRTALWNGAIPVLITQEKKVNLPFSEVIDYRPVLFLLPLSRLPEVHFILSSLDEGTLFSMRRQGRLLIDRYWIDLRTANEHALAVVRLRLNFPPAPLQPEVENIANDVVQSNTTFLSPETDEYLGPLTPPQPSVWFTSNFTTLLTVHRTWNNFEGSPLLLHPSTPFVQPLPTEAHLDGSAPGFAAINGGEGGSGKKFSEALGGNFPAEQFTVVMLTHQREEVLMESLQRLSGLPYLNQVLVVWNDLRPPKDLLWPRLTAPLTVILAGSNSLNNRFKPWPSIRTDAVLSIDDDVHLRHDEIMFAFRVWRESRDRIVGFPARFHAWDGHGGWWYNSNHTCQLSMVLTGAAFLHRHYLYLYTHEMPAPIRNLVDEYVNCEDIAINFLVAHATRKPPVKVTSRWTFHCPGCPDTLSTDYSHFTERHHCINYFTKVYGYNPLLFTQSRSDSVLFKTRIPSAHQKCFKFV